MDFCLKNVIRSIPWDAGVRHAHKKQGIILLYTDLRLGEPCQICMVDSGALNTVCLRMGTILVTLGASMLPK